MLNKCIHESNAVLKLYKYDVVSDPSPYCEPEINTSRPILDAIVYLSLEELFSTKEDRNVGSRSDYRLFTGRCVSPILLPAPFKGDFRYVLEFDYHYNQERKEQPCYVRKLPSSRLGLDPYFGSYVEIEVYSK